MRQRVWLGALLLTCGAFAVAGVGVAQAESTAPPGEVVLVMVDTSGSMEGQRLRDARASIREFIAAVDDDVRVGVGAFADDASLIVSPTLDRNDVLQGVKLLSASGDTALFDAIAFGLDQEPDRLIVISDGEDTASTRSFAEVRALVGTSVIPIDVQAVSPEAGADAQLRAIASQSGGQLLSSLAGVADELRGDQSPATSITSPERSAIAVSPAEGTPTASTESRGGIAPLLIAFAGFVAVLVLVITSVRLFIAWDGRNRTREVLSHYFALEAEGKSATAQRRGSAAVTQLAVPILSRVQQCLEAANLGLRAPTWIAVVGASMLGSTLLIWLLPVPNGFAAIGLVVGYLVPTWYLSNRRSRVQRQFEAELPEFLALVASGLRSGLSFSHAVSSAATHGSDALGRQMRRVAAEVSVGASLPDALDHVAERMASADLAWTVQALRVQEQAGGSLSRILDIAANTVRQRTHLTREVRALSAEGRLSAIILMLLPIAIFLFLLITRPEYVAVFWSEPLGWVMFAVFGILLVIGTWWMRRVIEIRV